ncbi:MAG: flagellin [Candidatus Caenarcaniphilales bacterium]|nr:flagellin [Candidatus Caenarcaniphilales bacterium]
MGITVNTNVQSLFAQRALRMNTGSVQKSIERLSTGFRINRAGDDAAGLSISNKMTTLIRGMNQAKRNIGDGIAMISTIDSALGTVQDNLQRIRELTVQALNGTNSEDELAAIQREVNERIIAIDDMGTQATFNGVNLLKGTQDITLQIGAENGQTLKMETSATVTADTGFKVDFSSTTLGSIGEGTIDLSSFSVGSKSVGTVAENSTSSATAVAGTVTPTALLQLDSMIDNISRMRSTVGAYENSLTSNMDYLDRYSESLEGARSRVRDVDVAAESADLLKNQILQQTASAMLSQANSAPQVALSLLP